MRLDVWCTLLCLHGCFVTAVAHSFRQSSLDDGVKVLEVGNELKRENLHLDLGRRVYRLEGVVPFGWYEVKISFPASIPASFSIRLERELPELGSYHSRRLLNTEKLIFRAGDNDTNNEPGIGWLYVVVTAEADGVVARRGVKDRDTVTYNIVCDELSFGIPQKAWWVGLLAFLCLVLASFLPRFLPLQALLVNGGSSSSSSCHSHAAKAS